MKGKIKRFFQKTRSLLATSLTTRSYQGSGLGIFMRRTIKRINLHQIVGVNLAGVAFFAGIVMPQTQDLLSSVGVSLATQETIVESGAAPFTYRWPMYQFGLSQRFSYSHPGVDLTDPAGTPVYPIADGVVDWTLNTSYGYGRHILISHDRNIKSLYAHLSEILVRQGDSVTKDTIIGTVGSTGHATGNHLHLEIYDNGKPANPMEVLPLLKFVTPTAAEQPKT